LSTLAIIIMGLCFAGFLILAFLNPIMDPINTRVRRWVNHTRNPALRPLMILTHKYNDVLSLSVQLIVLTTTVGLIFSSWARAMILMSAMFIQATVVSVCKRLSSVDRPPQIAAHVFMYTGSYPSGHSAASMSFALLVPTVIKPYVPMPVTMAIAFYLFLVALLTAYGRLYLDVHWLSDILGGWFLSMAVYLFSQSLLV
jgi:undecaprenyl-diphosphatase